MQNQLLTEIDSRYVFRGYALLAALVGVGLITDGFLHPGSPYRSIGDFLLVQACGAASIGAIDDPQSRRRATGWFMLGALIGGFAIAMQLDNAVVAQRMLLILFVPIAIYTFAVRNGNVGWDALRLNTLFPHERSAHSRYEQQIREAASQEERHRLARDLHDAVKQQLFVIQTAAATAQARFDSDNPGAREAIDQVRGAAREAIAEMQAMLDQLEADPLENTGLVAALRNQCEALGFRTGAAVTFDAGELPPAALVPPGTQNTILRMAQEALSNIARHARAKHVDVSLTARSGEFTLTIRDDGQGFDTNHRNSGMGIGNMSERAREFNGTFEISSSSGGGTEVKATLPFERVTKENFALGMLSSSAMLFTIITMTFVGDGFIPGVAIWLIGFFAFNLVRCAVGYWRWHKLQQELRTWMGDQQTPNQWVAFARWLTGSSKRGAL